MRRTIIKFSVFLLFAMTSCFSFGSKEKERQRKKQLTDNCMAEFCPDAIAEAKAYKYYIRDSLYLALNFKYQTEKVSIIGQQTNCINRIILGDILYNTDKTKFYGIAHIEYDTECRSMKSRFGQDVVYSSFGFIGYRDNISELWKVFPSACDLIQVLGVSPEESEIVMNRRCFCESKGKAIFFRQIDSLKPIPFSVCEEEYWTTSNPIWVKNPNDSSYNFEEVETVDVPQNIYPDSLLKLYSDAEK
ncbi:MAG: hypothetical protein MK212_15300 [Saprospiraceae bacterium]|nr:hypothetical protein [Saprospiraceae bacterium]